LPKGFQDERYRTLIAALARRRGEMRLSQAEVAKRLGVHQQFVSRYETGERRLDIVEFWDVAQALELDGLELVRRLVADSGAPQRSDRAS
jgi:transcriptional regulator with XRE-family HTH domain